MLVYNKQFIIQYARYEDKTNETECVYCAVGTESSNTVQVDLRFKRLDLWLEENVHPEGPAKQVVCGFLWP
jgi:hypothetical protein